MILQRQRFFGPVRRIGGNFAIDHRAHHFLVIVHQHVVHEHRLVGRLHQLLAVEPGRFEHDIVYLPLPRRTRRIGQRRPLPVNRACLPIGIRGIMKGIQHLDFVAAHHQNAAVAAPLAGSLDVRRLAPLHMQLNVAELLARHQVAIARAFEVSVLYRPARRNQFAGIGALAHLRPLREILTVEQDGGVGRWRIRRGPRRHHRRVRPVRIVHVPLQAGQDGSVRETEIARLRLLLLCGRRPEQQGAGSDSEGSANSSS